MTEAVWNLFPSPVILETLRSQVSEHQKVYLVGGAVRDMLMQRRGRDLDFVVMGDALRLARRVADALGAGYYALDTERQTGRVIYTDEENKRWHLDFSLMRGGTIQEDLAARDFTINALAIRLDQLGQIIDPLHGAQDIKDRRLRACSPQSFHDDPLRVLRGVRLASEFGFRMTPETLAGLKAAVPGLAMVSVERQRDELFNILENPHSVAGLRVGFSLGVFDHLLPEVVALSGEIQDAPHIHDVFEHTLALVESLDTLFDLLVKPYSEDKSASLIYGLAVVTLGRFRQQLAQHFSTPLHPERSLIALVKLTGLLHDIAKPATRTVDDQGRMHFYAHEKLGAELVAQRGKELALSTNEVERISLLVHHHMRIHHLAKTEGELSDRSVYRYYRTLDSAGIDLVLLSLADRLATEGVTISPEDWQKELSVCRELLEAWFDHRTEKVQPERLINGDDLIAELHLHPGKMVGELLEAIREAQAEGQINSRESALKFARNYLGTKG